MPYSPRKFASRVGDIGKPLPDPWTNLARDEIHFRYGATSMIAGVPGSFKSVFGLNMVVNWARCEPPISSLYFSADSDELTVVKRLSGILTGDYVEHVEREILEGRPEKYQAELARLTNPLCGVEFEYEQMDIEEIARRAKAYEAIYGAYPQVIFLDNLIDYVSNPMAWDEMIIMTRDLDALARKLKCHVCILHHAKIRTSYKDDDAIDRSKPPADFEIMGKITQIPRLVLTMGAEGLSINMACVKNTNGLQFPDASTTNHFLASKSMRIIER